MTTTQEGNMMLHNKERVHSRKEKQALLANNESLPWMKEMTVTSVIRVVQIHREVRYYKHYIYSACRRNIGFSTKSWGVQFRLSIRQIAFANTKPSPWQKNIRISAKSRGCPI